jgi:hypothetical protein
METPRTYSVRGVFTCEPVQKIYFSVMLSLSKHLYRTIG